jgi:hypothetical protein
MFKTFVDISQSLGRELNPYMTKKGKGMLTIELSLWTLPA